MVAGSTSQQDIADATAIIQSYMEALYLYEKDYSDEHRFYIENYLLTDSDAIVGNDLTDIEDKAETANYYLIMLKEKQVKIRYAENYAVYNCTLKGRPVIGSIMEKTISYRDGYVEKRKEFFELKRVGNAMKINSISSDLFYDLSKFSCANNSNKKKRKKEIQTKPKDKCSILEKADKAYDKQDYNKALKLYIKAQDCDNNSTYIKGRIEELNTKERLKELIAQAELELVARNYKAALRNFSIVQDNTWLTAEEKDNVTTKITRCRQEISFSLFMKDGDAYFKKQAYLKALEAYYQALEMKPNYEIIQKKVAYVEDILDKQYEEKVLLEIEAGLNLMRHKKYEEGFTMLMKNHESGFLKGGQLFLMARILDTAPKKIKETFDFENSDCCIWTLRFMIEARSLGMNSDNFNFFWKGHLNKKSRTCIN